MYFVDKDILIKHIEYLDHLSHQLPEASGFELERITHMLIESTVDIGNMLIDAFILRDPGSYQDVIDILENEGAISHEDQLHFSETFKWRKTLIREYINIDREALKADFLQHISAYQKFKDSIYQFFQNEGQTVTAFKGDEDV